MQCEEFETRLNELLDARSGPERDAPLAAHAETCGSCRALLAAERIMLERFQADLRPAVSPEFTRQVLARSRFSRPRRQYVLAALAASLLIAAGIRWMPGVWSPPEGSTIGRNPIEAPTLPVAVGPPVKSLETNINYATAARQARQTLTDAIALLPTTESFLATEETPIEGQSSWSSEIADYIDPLTDSTGEAFNFLLSVLPGDATAPASDRDQTLPNDGA